MIYAGNGTILREPIAAVLFLIIPVIAVTANRNVLNPLKFSPRDKVITALLAGLSIYLFTRGAAIPGTYLLAWFSNDGPIPFLSSSLLFAFLVLVTTPLIAKPHTSKTEAKILFGFLFFSQLVSITLLLVNTQGVAIYHDDHPSFMFRIKEFTETYPVMTDFNPWWNAGVVNSVLASSGTGAVSLPFFFLWKAFPVHLLYTPIFGLIFIIIVPYLYIIGLRAVRASWTVAAAGGILGFGTSRIFFLWAIYFGTIGASFSMSFLPLFALLSYRICVMRKTDIPTLAGFAVTMFFLAQWPPCLIMIAFFVLGWLWNIRRFRISTHLKLLATLAITVLALIPNINAILSNRELLAFVDSVSKNESGHIAIPQAWHFFHALSKKLCNDLPKMNPLVLFFGLAGIFVMPQKRLRHWVMPAILCLFLLSAWGPFFAKHMQLERMALPAALLCTIPAAIFTGHITNSKSKCTVFAKTATLWLLVFGLASTVAVYAGMPIHAVYGTRNTPYTIIHPGLIDFAETVSREVPPDGRLLFFERARQNYGGGHIAYLPLLTGREMMASDYYDFPSGMVDYHMPPSDTTRQDRSHWRKIPADLAQYMRLHGATHITTHGGINESFIRGSGLFTEIPFTKHEISRHNNDYLSEDDADIDNCLAKVCLFKLNDSVSGRFYEGNGVVSAKFGSLTVTLNGNTNAVLRYIWNPNLGTVDNAKIYPVEVVPGIKFIGISAPENIPVIIKYTGAKR